MSALFLLPPKKKNYLLGVNSDPPSASPKACLRALVLHTKLEAVAFCAAPEDLHLQCVYRNQQCQLLDAVMLEKHELAHLHQNSTEWSLPLDAPESIRELALRPRIPRLLRRCPLPDFVPRNSLFR